MSEKEKALQQLSEIKSVLVDRDSFFPYNYNALIVWGVIGMFLTMVMPAIIKESVWQGTLLTFILMLVGFIVEGFLTKRVNEDYDIDTCTKKQRFIMTTFGVGTLFGLIFTALLAQQDLIIPIFAVWMFVCGMGDLVVGYVLIMRTPFSVILAKYALFLGLLLFPKINNSHLKCKNSHRFGHQNILFFILY